jgi:large subunit ribosomal protein L10
MAAARIIPAFKSEMREEFEELLKNHRYLILLDPYKARAQLLNEARKKQEKWGFKLKGGRNTIFDMALKDVSQEAHREMAEHLRYQNLFIFTNKNPYRIALRIHTMDVDLSASAGDVATKDIMVEAGNTGFPPGPIIGLFTAANIPTKVVSGSIYITRDTVVASKGEAIKLELAQILGKLGLRPIKARLRLKCAYDLEENILIRQERLVPDIEELREKISEGVKGALSLGIEMVYPDKTILPLVIRKAYDQAKNLALDSGYASPETVLDLLRAGITRATALLYKKEG